MQPRESFLLLTVIATSALPLVSLSAEAAPPEWRAYFGNLHAHSSVSDGVESPATAYKHAKQAGVDFLCLSEHNHNLQGSNTTQAGLTTVATEAGKATTSKFVALVGQEFSTIKGGNHVNVYDVSTQVPQELLSDYKRLFEEWLPEYQRRNPTRVVVAQFNHPENANFDYGHSGYTVKRNGVVKEFPNYAGDVAGFVRGADEWVRTIAILSGPADVNRKSETALPFGEHRDIETAKVRLWQTYLDWGLHLSPVADQDNHSASWGNRTAARTGVWVKGPLTRESLLRAIKANRTFATEDSNLSLWVSVGGQPMGSRISPPSDGRLTVEVEFIDADEPDARYSVELLREIIGDGNPPEVVDESGLVEGGATWTTTVDEDGSQSAAYLVKVTQFSTGGKRDDAWAAPTWIDTSVMPPIEEVGDDSGAVAAGVRYVGTRNGSVYHFPECRDAVRIKPDNLIGFAEKPAGRRLHRGCPR